MTVTPIGNPVLPAPALEMGMSDLSGIESSSLIEMINAAEDGKTAVDLSMSINDLMKNILSGNLFKSMINTVDTAWTTADAMDIPIFSDMAADKVMGLIPEKQMQEVEAGFSESLEVGAGALNKATQAFSGEISQSIEAVSDAVDVESYSNKLEELFAPQEERIAKRLKSEMDEDELARNMRA